MSSWLACSERADALREKALEYKARGHLDMYATTLAESQNLAERYVQQLQPARSSGGDPRILDILMRTQRLEIQQQRAQRSSWSYAAAIGKQMVESAGWDNKTITLPDVLRTRWLNIQRIQDFLDSLQLTAGRDWVHELSQREMAARQAAKDTAERVHKRQFGALTAAAPGAKVTGYASGPVGWTKNLAPKDEDDIQLAIGYLLRKLDLARMSAGGIWMDTSRAPVDGAEGKPDFSEFRTMPATWTTLVTVIEVKRELTSGPSYQSAVGQCLERMDRMFVTQPTRRTAYSMALGPEHVEVLVATKDSADHIDVSHTRKLPLSLSDPNASGLQNFIALACASPEAAGYELPAPPQVIPVDYEIDPTTWAPVKLSDGGSKFLLSPRPTQVFEVTVRERASNKKLACIVKVSTRKEIEAERRNLLRMAEDPYVVKVLETGDLQGQKDKCYLLLYPVGEKVKRGAEPVEVAQFLRELLLAVLRWRSAGDGWLHRDLSVANVGWGPASESGEIHLLAWDFATLSPFPAHAGPPGKLTGTPESMAIAVQQGMAATVSTELESVLYMAIKLSSLEPLHWVRAAPDDSDAKFAAMCNAHTFEEKVMKRNLEPHRSLIRALHGVFFRAGPASREGIVTTYVYRTDVQPQEVLKALDAWFATQ